MKEGCGTSWILWDRTIELFDCEIALSFMKRMNHPKVIQRSSGLPLPSRAQWAGWFLLSFKGWDFCESGYPYPVPQGQGHPAETPGWHCYPNAPGRQSTEPKKGLFWSLKIRWNLPCNFWACWGPVTPSFFPISPFWNGNVYLYLSHHCILEALNLSGFTGSKLERNFASGWTVPQAPPISDIDGI